MIATHFVKKIKKFLWFYTVTILVVLAVIFLILLYSNDFNLRLSSADFTANIGSIVTSPFFLLVALVPYALFLLFKNLQSVYRAHKIKGLMKSIFIKLVLPISLLYFGNVLLQQYRSSDVFDYALGHSVKNTSSKSNDYYAIDNKQRGIHVFHLRNNFEDFEILKDNNFEWITLTPFIGQAHYKEPALRQTSPEAFASRKEYYKAVKAASDIYNFKIMLKPHIWLREKTDGAWRSNIEMTTEEDWDAWFKNYSQVMLQYADIAQELGFEQFCIGTELETTVYKKPEKWVALIQEIKTVYDGKLTYAANWYEEYEKVPFWNELDYIGIQAYFPLSETDNPTLEEMEAHWNKHAIALQAVSTRFNKPILFTEIGYKSITGTSRRPWEWNGVQDLYSKISKEEQLLCYQSFFNTIWKKSWFHGIHIWEWQAHHNSDGNNTNFTLEQKPALNLIAEKFKEDSSEK